MARFVSAHACVTTLARARSDVNSSSTSTLWICCAHTKWPLGPCSIALVACQHKLTEHHDLTQILPSGTYEA